jgi:enoyl-CoA hydratase/carnithine racemase
MLSRGIGVHNFGEPVAAIAGLCHTTGAMFGENQMTDTILYSRIGHVGRLVLNNPQRHNSLGHEQLDAIKMHLTQVAVDRQVRVLIVTGTGEKTFCAGASLQELSDGHIGDDAFQKMTGQLADLVIPTICAMNGDVFGGGVELAVSCDFRIGIEGCRMRVPAAAIGLCYPLTGINRLVECLGVSLTKRILVAAEEFPANTLLEVGFLDHLVSPPNLDGFVSNFAQHIAGLAPLAVRSMKSILRQIAAGTINHEVAKELSTLCLESQDLQEGFAAKREKRSPRFTGR